MNVQSAVLVVHPALKSKGTSLDSMEANFFFSHFFVMDKERTMRALKP